MGSASLPDTKPATMAENPEKSTFKTLLKKPLQAIFGKKREKNKQNQPQTNTTQKPETNTTIKTQKQINTDVDALKRNLEKLYLSKKEKESIKEEEDEFKNFTIKIINEKEPNRQDSNCSEDSGFSEHDFSDKDIIRGLDRLKIKDSDTKERDTKEEERKKKLQTVFVARTPIRARDEKKPHATPYHQPIHQVNRALYTGSQVFVENTDVHTTDYTDYNDGALEMDMALTEIENRINNFPKNPQEGQLYWQTAEEYIQESINTENNILSEFTGIETTPYIPVVQEINLTQEVVNPVEEFAISNNIVNDEVDVNINLDDFDNDFISTLLTPPRSNDVQFSPSSFESPSPTHFYSNQTNSNVSDYMLSPALSTSNLSKTDDLEKYQDITQIEDSAVPTAVLEKEKWLQKDKSLSMKQFKDIQSKLSAEFAKRECCSPVKKDCKVVFRGYFDSLTVAEKTKMTLQLANLDLMTVYGILHHILLSLQSSADKETFQLAMFGCILERMLAEKPALFVEQYGLNLLKAAALRCPDRPVLTRYLVQCVRAGLNTDEGKRVVERGGAVFNEVDIRGDTLICALARRGDDASDVMAELLRYSEPPLFDVKYTNSDGKTALHVACVCDGDAGRALHAAHVLLAHGRASLDDTDVKNGDTCIHTAVSSLYCSRELILALFSHADRRQWRRLAHLHNASSTSPLDLARIASKSPSRQNYPQDVQNFLKKCR